jgi:hypothetical protein
MSIPSLDMTGGSTGLSEGIFIGSLCVTYYISNGGIRSFLSIFVDQLSFDIIIGGLYSFGL